jgi:hypothetical protein
MRMRRHYVILLAGLFASMGASYRTPNFIVQAPTPQLAERGGQWAEYYRKEKALQWLGREMPPWSEPCPLEIKITNGSPGGATSFNFDYGQVWQTMTVEGPVDRVFSSVLPHEITHTVFAHYFHSPVPRWADEGGAVLSEDNLERSRHDAMVRQILSAGRGIPLRRLFAMRDYPRDPREIGSLYAQGYSVANFLVSTSSRQTFLAFVAQGMQHGWDNAVQATYHYRSVDELQQAWLNYLKNPTRQDEALVARTTSSPVLGPAKRIVVRLTAPPFQPLQDAPAPTVRAQAADDPDWPDPRHPVTNRPGYLPGYTPATPSANNEPRVRLGSPQLGQ